MIQGPVSYTHLDVYKRQFLHLFGDKTAHGGRRRCPHRYDSGASALQPPDRWLREGFHEQKKSFSAPYGAIALPGAVCRFGALGLCRSAEQLP